MYISKFSFLAPNGQLNKNSCFMVVHTVTLWRIKHHMQTLSRRKCHIYFECNKDKNFFILPAGFHIHNAKCSKLVWIRFTNNISVG